MKISNTQEGPKVTGDNNQGYMTPLPSPSDQNIEYSYATLEDNPHILHTYLEPDDKVQSGQDIDPKYEKKLPDMQELPRLTSDTNKTHALSSQSPVNQDLKYNYVTPMDNSWIRHTYLTSFDTNKVKHDFDFPSKSPDDQNIECIYDTPDGDPPYQDVGGAKIGPLYQNMETEKLYL